MAGFSGIAADDRPNKPESSASISRWPHHDSAETPLDTILSSESTYSNSKQDPIRRHNGQMIGVRLRPQMGAILESKIPLSKRQARLNVQWATVFRTSRRPGQQLASRFCRVGLEAIEIALLRVPPRLDGRTTYRIWRRGGDSNPRYKF
jgi:hypothetical protein